MFWIRPPAKPPRDWASQGPTRCWPWLGRRTPWGGPWKPPRRQPWVAGPQGRCLVSFTIETVEKHWKPIYACHYLLCISKFNIFQHHILSPGPAPHSPACPWPRGSCPAPAVHLPVPSLAPGWRRPAAAHRARPARQSSTECWPCTGRPTAWSCWEILGLLWRYGFYSSTRFYHFMGIHGFLSFRLSWVLIVW